MNETVLLNTIQKIIKDMAEGVTQRRPGVIHPVIYRRYRELRERIGERHAQDKEVEVIVDHLG